MTVHYSHDRTCHNFSSLHKISLFLVLFVHIYMYDVYLYLLNVLLQADKSGEDPKEAKTVKLYMQIPPIEKMDAALSTLVCCE